MCMYVCVMRCAESFRGRNQVLPPMVSGLLDRALALARCNVEKGSYSRRQVDEFIDLVIGNAQLILQKADREVKR